MVLLKRIASLSVGLLLMCSCASTVSRSPDQPAKGTWTGGVTYGGSLNVFTPTLDSRDLTDPVTKEGRALPYFGYSFSDRLDVLASAYYDLSRGGLFGQLRYGLLQESRWKLALITEGALGRAVPENDTDTVGSYQNIRATSGSLTLALPLGIQQWGWTVFLGPELIGSYANREYRQVNQPEIANTYRGFDYGAYLGVSGPIAKIGSGTFLTLELTLRGRTAPKSLVDHDKDFYFLPFVSLNALIPTKFASMEK